MNHDDLFQIISVDSQGKVTTQGSSGAEVTYLDVTYLDPVVLHTVLELVSRSRVGVNKYGTTLYDNDQDDFLQHAKEEALDLANYLTKLQQLSQDGTITLNHP